MRDGAHLDRACLDLGHLRLQQAVHERAAPARNADLRLSAVVLGLEDHDQDGTAGMELLAGYLLLGRHHAFRAAKVDVHDAGFDAVDDSGGQLTSMLGHIAQDLGLSRQSTPSASV